MSMIKTLDEMIAMEARVKELEAEINKKAEYNMEAFERIATLEADNAKLKAVVDAAQAVVDAAKVLTTENFSHHSECAWYVGSDCDCGIGALEQAIKKVE